MSLTTLQTEMYNVQLVRMRLTHISMQIENKNMDFFRTLTPTKHHPRTQERKSGEKKYSPLALTFGVIEQEQQK